MCPTTHVLFHVALSGLAICLRADSSHAEARTGQVYVSCGSHAPVKDIGHGKARNEARMRHLLQPIPKGALAYGYTTVLVPLRYCDSKFLRSVWPGCAGVGTLRPRAIFQSRDQLWAIINQYMQELRGGYPGLEKGICIGQCIYYLLFWDSALCMGAALHTFFMAK